MKCFEKQRRGDGTCIEPEDFTRWKNENEERLEPYYRDNKSQKAWECLSSSHPKTRTEGIFYYSKEDLKNQLLIEQGYLCCYCNRIIHNDDALRAESQENIDFNDRRCTIEHIEAKSDNARANTFDYCNLAASCSGGERIPENIERYCNLGRSNQDLAIIPFDSKCEILIYYDAQGNIHSDDEKIKKTIGYINEGERVPGVLNLIVFNEDRGIHIKPALYQNWVEYKIAIELNKAKEIGAYEGDPPVIPKLTHKSKSEAILIINELKQKDENGKYKEFCAAIISVLKRDIIDISE